MHKSVGKCLRHLKRDGLIGSPVTGSYNDTVIGELMLADCLIERYLISRRLNRRRCGTDLVEEQDIDNFFRFIHIEDLRLQPDCQSLILIGCWDAAKIDRIKEQQSDIGDINGLAGIGADPVCDLPYGLRLTDSGRTPEHN